jgi:hypothetical protein
MPVTRGTTSARQEQGIVNRKGTRIGDVSNAMINRELQVLRRAIRRMGMVIRVEISDIARRGGSIWCLTTDERVRLRTSAFRQTMKPKA